LLKIWTGERAGLKPSSLPASSGVNRSQRRPANRHIPLVHHMYGVLAFHHFGLFGSHTMDKEACVVARLVVALTVVT
jgi:hypothetical protein